MLLFCLLRCQFASLINDGSFSCLTPLVPLLVLDFLKINKPFLPLFVCLRTLLPFSLTTPPSGAHHDPSLILPKCLARLPLYLRPPCAPGLVFTNLLFPPSFSLHLFYLSLSLFLSLSLTILLFYYLKLHFYGTLTCRRSKGQRCCASCRPKRGAAAQSSQTAQYRATGGRGQSSSRARGPTPRPLTK